MVAARIVGLTALNLKEFLPLMQQALGRDVASVADAADFSPPLHHLMCIAAVKQPTIRASVEQARPQANMFHVLMMLACDERDTAEILEVASMPSILVASEGRGVDCVLLSGTLEQWINASIRGCQTSVAQQTREAYNAVYNEFTRLRLAGLFKATPTDYKDSTFLLIEDKR